MAKNQRIEVPGEVAARVLFLSDRTCCVCREPRKPVQIHHVDEDSSNSGEANLAVLCFDCHHLTQIRGGFDRKLDARQVILYRDDWYGVVERRRHGPDNQVEVQLPAQSWVQGLTQVRLEQKSVRLSYLQVNENDDENRYSLGAEYPEITPNDSKSASTINLDVAAFISRTLQRFRAEAIGRSEQKREILRKTPGMVSAWDDISISFDVILFSDDLLVLEFRIGGYVALAAHPNHSTRTFNFLLRPTVSALELHDLFRWGSRYLEFISQYCIASLHSQMPQTLKESLSGGTDSWIIRGAAPRHQNFEKFLITKRGLRILFDPYEVSCYAEGRREVFIPSSALKEYLKEPFLTLMD